MLARHRSLDLWTSNLPESIVHGSTKDKTENYCIMFWQRVLMILKPMS